MTRDREASALSIVERGWRGARTCSKDLSAHGVFVRHLIKGWLSPEVCAMIQPWPRTTLISTPRWLFRAQLWWWLMGMTLSGRLRWVLIDHERTWRETAWWCRWTGITPVMIQEVGEAYALEIGGRRVTCADIVEQVSHGQAASRARV